jgi:hypothetical protein
MLDQLKALGVGFKVRQGRLEVSGLSALSVETADDARQWIREHRDWIIQTLDQKKAHPARVTPAQVARWRVARKWILPRLPTLQAMGWTRRTLFAAGRLRFPHGEWGAAWLSLWTRAGVTVEQAQGGEIVFSFIEAGGRVVTQAARPEGVLQ